MFYFPTRKSANESWCCISVDNKTNPFINSLSYLLSVYGLVNVLLHNTRYCWTCKMNQYLLCINDCWLLRSIIRIYYWVWTNYNIITSKSHPHLTHTSLTFLIIINIINHFINIITDIMYEYIWKEREENIYMKTYKKDMTIYI